MVSAIYCAPIIYDWKQAEDTAAQGIVYDFDGSEAQGRLWQPLVTIDVMNSIAKLFGYGPLRSTTEVPGHCSLFLREVECARPTTSLSRKGRKEGAVRVACAECILLRRESSLAYPSRLQPSNATHRIRRQSIHLRRSGDPSIGRIINPCQGNVL